MGYSPWGHKESDVTGHAHIYLKNSGQAMEQIFLATFRPKKFIHSFTEQILIGCLLCAENHCRPQGRKT